MRRELAGVTPESPRVSEMETRIGQTQAVARRAEKSVLAAIARGEFDEARRHLSEDLASVTPDSPQVADLETRIARVQAGVKRVEQEISEAIDRANFEEARRLVKALSELTPNSRKVSRTSAKVDEARGSALSSGRMMSEALERGEFDEARRLVDALAEITPDSPRVAEMFETIDRVQTTARRTEEEAAEAIGRGEFDKSRKLVGKLASVIPAAAGRIAALEGKVERAQATAAAAEKSTLDAIAKALAAVDRGDHDARIHSAAVARTHLAKLAGVSPLSPRAKELEERIARAELIPAMARVRGGELKIKDSSGTRKISVNAYWIGKYEVTFDEFDRFVAETNQPAPGDAGWGRGRRPVINVSWNVANEYAEWLSGKLGVSYRLPTATEWEYAARAGSRTEYPWGKKVGTNRANCKGCGSRWDKRETAPVGSFPGNALGLHDVVGNVCEWTCSTNSTGPESRKCAPYRKVKEMLAPDAGEGTTASTIFSWVEKKVNSRVCRGGSWKYGPRKLLSMESKKEQTESSRTIGFRLVRD